MSRASLLSLLLAAGIAALMACEPAARPPAMTAAPGPGGGGIVVFRQMAQLG